MPKVQIGNTENVGQVVWNGIGVLFYVDILAQDSSPLSFWSIDKWSQQVSHATLPTGFLGHFTNLPPVLPKKLVALKIDEKDKRKQNKTKQMFMVAFLFVLF